MEETKEESTINLPSKIEKRKTKLKNFFFGWIKDNYDKAFLIILLIAFAIRLYIFFQTMDQPLWWDAADYLATAKRWGLGLNIRDIWYYRRGFLFPLIGALFFKLGLGETGIRFLMVLFSTGIIFLSYFIISKMFNKKLALLTTIPLTLSWVILFFTGRILTDIPAAFFLLLALLLFWKGYVQKQGNKFLYLFGFFFALAVLTRMQSLMLAPPFLIYIFIKERFKAFKNKHLWITLGIFLLLLLPHLIVYSMHYGNALSDITTYYLKIGGTGAEFPVVAQTHPSIFNYLFDVPYIISGISNTIFTPLFFLLLIGGVYFLGDLFIGFDKILKDKTMQNKIFIILWVASLFLLMGYIASQANAPYVEQRYMIAALPFLFLIALSPFILLEKILKKYFKMKKALSIFIIIIIISLLLIPSILLANSLITSKQNSYLEIKNAGKLMKENSNPEDIIISTSLPQITYYSERSTYPYDVQFEGKHKGDKELQKYSDGEEGFKQFLLDKKPKFLMASLFETDPEWILNRGQQNGFNFITLPFFNSSVVFDSQSNQLAYVDLKDNIKKQGNINLKLFYPTKLENINGIFIYEVEYD